MTVMFWPVVIFMAISLAIGLYTYTQVQGSSKRYTVCNKSMPFIVIGTALTAQAVDGNATLGNTSLTYSTSFWTGLMIPMGLAVSLWIVGVWIAGPLNRMSLLTLPEFFFRRYGKSTELLVSILTTVCFTVLIAGNLSAVAWILSVVSGMSYGTSLIVATAVIVAYTIAGGLYAAIWTDFFQIHVAIAGFVLGAGWLLITKGWDPIMSAVPAIKIDASTMTQIGAGALSNWAAVISLAIGNCVALDFMERVFAARGPKVASRACMYAGTLTVVVGLCASFMGLAAISMVPKVEDVRMVLPTLASEHMPFWIGVLVFVGVLGASMSTANGAMLVMAVVLARNVWQRWSAREVGDETMLFLSRILAIPTAAAAAWVAYVRPEPGILLVVAFDIVFAGCVAPLIFGIYWPKANAMGAVSGILSGTLARLVCYLAVPPALAGLDTLIPPMLSTVVFVSVCLATQKQPEQRHARLFRPLPEDMLVPEPVE